MCRMPVTFGGGRTMENLGLADFRSAAKRLLVEPEFAPLLLDRLGVVGFGQLVFRAHDFDIHSLTSARTLARTRFSISLSMSTISSRTTALISGPPVAAGGAACGPRPRRRRRASFPGQTGSSGSDDGPVFRAMSSRTTAASRSESNGFGTTSSYSDGRGLVGVDALEGPPQADERDRGQLLAAPQGPADVVAVPARAASG